MLIINSFWQIMNKAIGVDRKVLGGRLENIAENELTTKRHRAQDLPLPIGPHNFVNQRCEVLQNSGWVDRGAKINMPSFVECSMTNISITY